MVRNYFQLPGMVSFLQEKSENCTNLIHYLIIIIQLVK